MRHNAFLSFPTRGVSLFGSPLPPFCFTIFPQSSVCWRSQNRRSIIHFYTHRVLLRILYFVEPSSKYLNYSVIQCFILVIVSSFVYKLCSIIPDFPPPHRAYFTMTTFLFLAHVVTWCLWRKVSFKSLLSSILPLVISRDVLFIFLRCECNNSPETCLIFSHFYFLLQRNNLHRPTPKNLSFVKHEILITADI
jgi:hypothetical protein